MLFSLTENPPALHEQRGSHLCGSSPRCTRRVGCSAAAGLLGALLLLCLLGSLYLFVLLLHQPDEGVTAPCQLLQWCTPTLENAVTSLTAGSCMRVRAYMTSWCQ